MTARSDIREDDAGVPVCLSSHWGTRRTNEVESHDEPDEHVELIKNHMTQGTPDQQEIGRAHV